MQVQSIFNTYIPHRLILHHQYLRGRKHQYLKRATNQVQTTDKCSLSSMPGIAEIGDSVSEANRGTSRLTVSDRTGCTATSKWSRRITSQIANLKMQHIQRTEYLQYHESKGDISTEQVHQLDFAPFPMEQKCNLMDIITTSKYSEKCHVAFDVPHQKM